MVGGAILFVVMVATTRVTKQNIVTQSNIDRVNALDSFHGVLKKTIQNAANCNATFRTQALATSITAPTTIHMAPTSTYTGLTAAESAIGAAFISVGQWIDEAQVFRNATTQTWRLTSMAFETSPVTAATPTTGRTLVVTYRENAKFGNQVVTRRIPLHLRFGADTGRFLECLNPQANTVNNAQNSLCYGMDPTMITTTGEIAVWDDETQRCVLQVNPIACPVGTAVRGLNSDGTLRCMPTDEGVDNRIPNNSATTCAPGRSMRVNYVGGVMTIQCL
jgi:hypothetical protein